ncbi:transcriptional regulator [Klebsiella michiganensis]|uniref:transcriptional regulator n=1 Tax=Klebsiella michiganensis TaxID=1134687 RepID=UPI000FF8D31B|nr:transcriptional regulator [Klebsiella michiganensis]QAS64429.1 hypothetical protein KOCBH_01872 [Klebsiella michiganensis]
MTDNNQFIMVPLELLKIKQVNGITFNDGLKNLYCYLKGWNGNAFPSYSKMAEVFGVTSRAMEERIKILVKMKLINKVNRNYTSNFYEVLEIPLDSPPESIHASPVEDVKTLPDAIPQTKSEEPAQSDTDTSDDDIKPFCTSSQEAHQDELDFDSLPVASAHTKRANDDMEPLCNIFINYFSEGERLTNESFAEFARRVFDKVDSRYPAGFEIYFSKAYPKIYMKNLNYHSNIGE